MKTKLTLAILALLLAARLGAADAPTSSYSVPASQMLTLSLSIETYDKLVIGDWFTLRNDDWPTTKKPHSIAISQSVLGTSQTLLVKREPIVTRTADGWSITFREPVAVAAPSQMPAVVPQLTANPPPATNWNTHNGYPIIRVSPYEFGLRSDGVVVWRRERQEPPPTAATTASTSRP